MQQSICCTDVPPFSTFPLDHEARRVRAEVVVVESPLYGEICTEPTPIPNEEDLHRIPRGFLLLTMSSCHHRSTRPIAGPCVLISYHLLSSRNTPYRPPAASRAHRGRLKRARIKLAVCGDGRANAQITPTRWLFLEDSFFCRTTTVGLELLL